MRQLFAAFRIPHADAEDILQDVLMRAFRRWSRIRSPEAWLIVTLRYRCWLDVVQRRDSRLQSVDSDFLEALAPTAAPEQERAETRHDLDRLFAGLDERHKNLLILRYLWGYSPEECAERLGYRVSSVRKLSGRALARVVRRLEESRAATLRR